MIWIKRNARVQKINRTAAIVSAAFLISVWALVLIKVGSPRILLYFADQKASLIPSWLFLLGSFLFYGVCGACVGAVLFCRAARKEVYKYKGAFFFSLSLASGYLWYAAAFGSRFFVLATLMALAATFFLSVSAVCFYKVIPLTVIGMLFSLLWMIYLIILSLFFFFFL